MRLLISATSRSGKRFQGRGVEGNGCIYICDLNIGNRELHLCDQIYLPKPIFIGREHRLGARGIAKLPTGLIACANHDSLFLFDKNMQIKKSISLPSMGDIHDLLINESEEQIYATCSSSDSIQFFDYNLNHVGAWKACEEKSLSHLMKKKKNAPIRYANRQNFPLHDYRMSFNGDIFHLNNTFKWNDDRYIVFSSLAKLYNINKHSFCKIDFGIDNPNAMGGRLHGGILRKNNLVILNTHYGRVERYNMIEQRRVSYLNCAKPLPTSSGLNRVKQYGFLRGMYALSDNEFLVGQIGPSIYYCNFSTGEVSKLIDFEGSNKWSIYAIEQI